MRVIAAVCAVIAALVFTADLGAQELKETVVKEIGVLPAKCKIIWSGPVFTATPDGSRLAWVEEDPATKMQWVMCEGKSSPQAREVLSLQFSEDGKRFLFALKDAEHSLYMDGKPVRNGAKFLISPDGKRIAYMTSSKTSGDDLWLNGTHLAHAGVECWAFSADSKHFGYFCPGDLIVDGKKILTADEVTGLVFGGAHWAARVKQGNNVRVATERGLSSPFRSVERLTFSPDGTRLAFVTDAGSSTGPAKTTILLDGKPIPVNAPERLEDFVFSPDSKHVAYILGSNEGYRFICDGLPGAVVSYYPHFVHIAFSSDSRHLAWTVVNEKQVQLTCDGVPGPVHSDVIFTAQAASVPPGKIACYVLDRQPDGSSKLSLVHVDVPADRTWGDFFGAKKP